MDTKRNPHCLNQKCNHYMIQACDHDTRQDRCQHCKQRYSEQAAAAQKPTPRMPVQLEFDLRAFAGGGVIQ